MVMTSALGSGSLKKSPEAVLMRSLSPAAGPLEITLPDTAPCAGSMVADLNLPKDAALVAIVRGSRVITPAPEEPLEPGDELLFVALPEVETAIRDSVYAA